MRYKISYKDILYNTQNTANIITLKNCESPYCTPITQIILYINSTYTHTHTHIYTHTYIYIHNQISCTNLRKHKGERTMLSNTVGILSKNTEYKKSTSITFSTKKLRGKKGNGSRSYRLKDN